MTGSRLAPAGAIVHFRTSPAGVGLPPTRTTGGPISTELRINERIRVPEVRLVGPNGETVGIVPTDQALKLAQEADLDLVEIAPQGRPPVCKLMDYGKFKYENAQKARESRRNQTNVIIKEMKLRPKIDAHDYATKKGHVVRFLKAGDKVKITIMFRGREQHRPELGFRLLQRLAEDVTELGAVCAGLAPGRGSRAEITLFDSTGLAIQDLAIALGALEALRVGAVKPQTVSL